MGHGDSWSNSIFDLSPSPIRVIKDLNPLLGESNSILYEYVNHNEYEAQDVGIYKSHGCTMQVVIFEVVSWYVKSHGTLELMLKYPCTSWTCLASIHYPTCLFVTTDDDTFSTAAWRSCSPPLWKKSAGRTTFVETSVLTVKIVIVTSKFLWVSAFRSWNHHFQVFMICITRGPWQVCAD
ncbi:hypothetical protein Cni_G25281 [Canna indica]|uniref:Uncharacterized protein n=1 Tax=Canna indica TaxID=4628 RepID=A0AAQ3KXE0_9LILI|nr:hypothetical protein Cni_G25281 [Canna indica]